MGSTAFTGVSIIVLNYDNTSNLYRLLETFFNVNTYTPFEFIIVEHTVKNNTEEVVDKFSKKAPIQFLKRDKYYSSSNSRNYAAKYASYPHLHFISSDIIYSEDILPLALAQLQDERIGVVGIRIDDDPNSLSTGTNPSVQHVGVKFNWDEQNQLYIPYQLQLASTEEAKKVKSGLYPAVNGSFLLCRKSDFDRLGGFSEDYHYGLEDIDFCLQLKKKLNKASLCINEKSLLSPSNYSDDKVNKYDLYVLNEKYKVDLFKNFLKSWSLSYQDFLRQSINIHTTRKYNIQTDEDMLRVHKWQSLVAEHEQKTFMPPDLSDLPPVGWVQPHLNTAGGIRRAIEMSNRLAVWGADFYLITPQGIKTDWLPIRANVIAYDDALQEDFGAIIVSDPECINMFNDISKKAGLFYHLHAYMLYRKKNDAFHHYYLLCKEYPNVSNSQWTADQVEEYCGVSSLDILPGGIYKSQFQPFIVDKVYDTCFFGVKNRIFKATKELKETLKGLTQLPLSDYNLSQEILAPAICASRVFVSGSYYEGFNFCPLEAMACGVPVVMTDCGGSREYAINEENALVVSNGDYKILREQVDRLLRDKKLRLRLIENGMETAWKFDWNQVTSRLAGILQGTLKDEKLQQNIFSEVKKQSNKEILKFQSSKKETGNHQYKGEQKVKQLRHKLLELGFTERAYTDLKKLLTNESNPSVKKMAAWELALWHANKYSEEDARQCLELLFKVTQGENNQDRLNQAVILKAECHDLLGELETAKQIIQEALSSGPNADLYLAAANLEKSVSLKIDYINKALEIFGISRISFENNNQKSNYDCLRPGSYSRRQTANTPKVTVIMPVHNAEHTISTAINSILNQTWTNLEILVVDDCSTDNTAKVVQGYEIKDSRVKLIKSEKNQGPYVARNMALKVATGDFVTCNDADDWSHPEKIEIQARHLNNNPHIMANVSNWARATNGLKFYRRGNPGFYIQLNVSSLMFRREPIIRYLGYWDSVRFGADTEFFKRIKKVFGDEAIKEISGALLSFGRCSENSLTENKAFGYPGYPMGARKEYRDSYLHYYKKKGKLKYQFPQKNRPFPVPEIMHPIKFNATSERHFDVIIAFDFRLSHTYISIIDEIKTLKRKNNRIGLVQMARYDVNPSKKVDPKVRELIDGEYVQMLVYGEKVLCDILVIGHLPVIQEKQLYIPDVEAKAISVIVDQVLEKEFNFEDFRYNIKRCAKHLIDYFGKAGVWYPVNAQVRSKLYMHHADEIKEIHFSKEEWSNIIDAKERQKLQSLQHSTENIIKQESTLSGTPNSKFTASEGEQAIEILDVRNLDSFTYIDNDGVAVIMPCIDTKQGQESAEILYRRAGMDCKILVVNDTLRQGFIKTLNDTASRVFTKYIVYLAQDAFPGRGWLCCAYNALEESGKGLLAFNDGKWKGRIAAFGMVRKEWVKNLYGDRVFYQAYNAHKADNELTVIARVQNMHVYNPDCTLIEYDPDKDLFGGSNPQDDELFKMRFQQGFNGLVPLEELEPLTKEYFVSWNVKQSATLFDKVKYGRCTHSGKIVNHNKINTYNEKNKTMISRFAIILGAMKAGTTTLYKYLIQHPEISSNLKNKEPNFFSSDEEWNKGFNYYYKQWSFEPKLHSFALEASTNYTKLHLYPEVPKRMRAMEAEFKFIYILRNPIHRIESHIAHNLSKGRVSGDNWKEHALAVSSYAMQLELFYKYFPDANILLLDFEEFKNAPCQVLNKIVKFLGINSNFNFREIPPQNVRKPIPKGKSAQLTDKEREYLIKQLNEDMIKLRDKYGFDINKWDLQ